MIRFHVDDGEHALTTEWQDEIVQFRLAGEPTALTMMTALRKQYPTAAIRIERMEKETTNGLTKP